MAVGIRSLVRCRNTSSALEQAGGLVSFKKARSKPESERKRERERPMDFLISRKMESFSRASALHAHPLSRTVIKQIEPLPSRRNKPHRPPALRPRPLPKSRNLNKFTSVCTRINFTSFLAPLSLPLALYLFLFLSIIPPPSPLSLLSLFLCTSASSLFLTRSAEIISTSPRPCGFSFATVDE